MTTANTSRASSVLRRLGAPIAPIVDVCCVDGFVVLLIVCQGLSRLAYCLPHSETTFCSSSERLGPGLGVGAVVDGGVDFSGAFAESEGFGVGDALDVEETGVVPVVPTPSPAPDFASFSLFAQRRADFIGLWEPSTSRCATLVLVPPR